MGARSQLRRWHIWLGWIIGLPILLWVVSGLVMVVRPIEEVRGTDLLRHPPAVHLHAPPIAPPVVNIPVETMELGPGAGGPRWVVTFHDGSKRRADAASGQWLPPVSAADAMAEVTSRYRGSARLETVRRTDPANPPLDLRRPIAAWQVRLDDGTHFYVDAQSGEIVATRTRFWRIYDWMWGLHIMDLKTREDTHNPLVIGFAIIALVTTILALVLLPMTIRRRRRAAVRADLE